MQIYNDIVQGTDEWLNLRLGKFGSTDAQAVSANGKGLDTLIYKKVAEKLTGRFEDNYTNPDMERGKELEGLARSSYEMETGSIVKEVGYVELNDYVGGSPDGLVGEDGMIEIKCRRDSLYVKSAVSRSIDTKYIWQMQHFLYITNRQWCDFVVFSENFPELIRIRVERDEAAINKIKIGLKSGIAKIESMLEQLKRK